MGEQIVELEFENQVLKEENLRLRTLLKRVEWRGYEGWGPPCCSECEGWDPSQLGVFAPYANTAGHTGHFPNCELAAFLYETESGNE